MSHIFIARRILSRIVDIKEEKVNVEGKRKNILGINLKKYREKYRSARQMLKL